MTCRRSPTKAHHYLIPAQGEKPVGVCKFCGRKQEHENWVRYDHWYGYPGGKKRPANKGGKK